jgi:predicted Zn-dependent protease with MMP-like domain
MTANTPHHDLIAPGLDIFEALAAAALAGLPAPYDAAARQIALRIVDFAPDDILAGMAIADPFELTGLYEGIPLTEKSVMDQPMGPDVIMS